MCKCYVYFCFGIFLQLGVFAVYSSFFGFLGDYCYVFLEQALLEHQNMETASTSSVSGCSSSD